MAAVATSRYALQWASEDRDRQVVLTAKLADPSLRLDRGVAEVAASPPPGGSGGEGALQCASPGVRAFVRQKLAAHDTYLRVVAGGTLAKALGRLQAAPPPPRSAVGLCTAEHPDGGNLCCGREEEELGEGRFGDYGEGAENRSEDDGDGRVVCGCMPS